jgi:uncharacterized repeat protein (TIGR03803 family)
LFVISTLSLIALAVGSQAAQSQTFTVLHAFTGGEDGATPWAGLTLDRAGILYGTTTEGLWGTVFQLKRTDGSWILNTLNGFGVNQQDARFPLGRVVFGPDGTLYGTTLYGGSGHCSGGCGTVYNLRPPATDCKTVVCPWTRTVLYSFTGGPDGIGPYYVDPVFDHAGNLYGTTGFGGSAGDGAVFKLTPSGGGWTESVIHSFTGDGMEPESGVIFDSAGNLYGTTAFGGRYDQGTIYQLTPSGSGWNARILYSFQGIPDGALPFGALIFDRSGNLYGTTTQDGILGGGTVFKLASSGGSWTLSVLYALRGSYGCGPQGALAMDAAGNLYGTTVCGGANLNGSVFKLTPIEGGWTSSSLHDFTGGSDGGYPMSGVTLDANGNVYGTAERGGENCFGGGCGVVWEITP